MSRKLRRAYLFAIALAATLIGPAVAPAATISIGAPVTRFTAASYAFDSGGRATFSYDAFASVLGGFNWRIERAVVTVTQSLFVNLLTSPNLAPVGSFQSAPQAYGFTLAVSQSLTPAGLFAPPGFESATPRQAFLNGVATGAGGVATVSLFESFSLRFDATSDLIGGLDFAGDGQFQAMRRDFLATFFADRITSTIQTTARQLAGVRPVTPIGFAGGGSVIVQYDGTLVGAVPTPGSLPLLATGLLALIALRRLRPGVRKPDRPR